MTPLDEGSARCRDLDLTTHNIHNRQTRITPARFENAIQANERPQNYALDVAATGMGRKWELGRKSIKSVGIFTKYEYIKQVTK
jgi:hypothetical protein